MKKLIKSKFFVSAHLNTAKSLLCLLTNSFCQIGGINRNRAEQIYLFVSENHERTSVVWAKSSVSYRKLTLTISINILLIFHIRRYILIVYGAIP
ncbi:hypothetical protein KMI_04g07880 [Encephalitozoon hellem]|nr:hypothetical protein KMI_04g07880 [Encephalitozoon hellem]